MAEHMHIRIERGNHLPIHAQIEEQIKFLILSGELAPGTRLPTTRHLAGFLRINRNTIVKAYQALAQEGLIECQRGRGCVVVERPVAAAPLVSSRLLDIVDRAIEQAGELGVGPDDFATVAYARARQRPDVQVRHRLMFVECEATIAATLARIVQDRLDIEVVPVVLGDLQQPTAEVEELLCQVQVVATTFFHVQEVRRLLAKAKKEVVGLGIKPHLENLIQVAGIPHGMSTALVCVSECCARELKQSLEDAGVKGLDTSLYGTDDPHKMTRGLPQHPVVIASDFVADEVRPLLQPGQELITLDYTTLDEGAINLLRSLVSGDLQPR